MIENKNIKQDKDDQIKEFVEMMKNLRPFSRRKLKEIYEFYLKQ